MNAPTSPCVLVMGAGSVGCWLGGRLQSAGAEVHYVGRPRMLQALGKHGLTLTDPGDGRIQLPARQLRLYDQVPGGLAPDLVLLCVKSGATAEAAAELDQHLPPRTLVLSMQNGVSNTDVARAAAPGLDLRAGMVPFSVVEMGPGHLHRATDGQMAVENHPALQPWLPAFKAAGLPLTLTDDLRPAQWGKLLLDLNNAVNALSGLPLRAQLLDADLRRCTAALVSETLYLLKQAGIQPASVAPVRPRNLPRVLRLPTPLFRVAGRRMLHIDAKVRSSMLEDMLRRRPPEIEAVQGEVLRLANRQGILAPCNSRITMLIKSWTPRSEPLSGKSLRKFMNV